MKFARQSLVAFVLLLAPAGAAAWERAAPAAASQPAGSTVLQTCLAAAADWTPVYPTSEFPAAKEVAAVFRLGAGARPKGMEATWIAVDAKTVPPNTVLTTQKIKDLSAGLLKLASPKTLPLGKYRLEVTADGQPWKSIDFQIVAPPAPPKLDSAADQVTLSGGTTWAYDFTLQAGGDVKLLLDDIAPDADGTSHAVVTATVADVDDRLGSHLELRRKDKVVSEEWWKIDPKLGLLATQRKVGDEVLKLDPPQVLWPWPLKTPKSWTYRPKDKSYQFDCQMWGPVPVKARGGPVNGYVVLLEQTRGDFKLTCERHYAPGIGLVQETIVNARKGEMLNTQRMSITDGK